MGDWSTWSACDVTCGGGTSTRSREIDVDVVFGGVACPDAYADQPCNDQACPIDCVTESWTAWSACSASCGPGEQSRTRAITTTPDIGGRACPASAEDSECNSQACPIDCVLGDWNGFSNCDKSCGTGIQSRERSIAREHAFGGAACPDLIDSQNCNAHSCPVDCVVPAWTDEDWGACSVSCGGGTRTRTRVAS
jgi:hemicentin